MVSVVIPAFNVAGFIEQSVKSVLAQTFSDFEIIVVDDGSTDDTEKVVGKFRDDRISAIRKANGGCASARNAGFAVSRGEYVAFLDGDDYWFPTMLERHLMLFDKHPQADMVFCLSCVVDENDRSWGLMKTGQYRTYSFQDLVIENPVGNGSAALIRRKALELTGPFDESLPASSDCDMWLRIARIRPDNFVCLPEILTCYRRRSEQTTGNWRRMRIANEQLLSKARSADRVTVERVEHLSRCNTFRYHAFIAYEAGELKKAWGLLRKSFHSSRRKFLMDPRSWLLAFAIVSKAVFPVRLHVALTRFFVRLRQSLFTLRSRLQRPHY